MHLVFKSESIGCQETAPACVVMCSDRCLFRIMEYPYSDLPLILIHVENVGTLDRTDVEPQTWLVD